MNREGTKPSIDAYEEAPATDIFELTVGATSEVDASAFGGYPVRVVVVLAGSGTLAVQTAGSGTLLNRASTVVPGDRIGPAQITSIRGTTDATLDRNGIAAPSVGVTKVRVYK